MIPAGLPTVLAPFWLVEKQFDVSTHRADFHPFRQYELKQGDRAGERRKVRS